MALEDLAGPAKYINALNPSWPVDDDFVDEGDNHVRGIKNVLKNSFPNIAGAVTATEGQLNTIASGPFIPLAQKAAASGVASLDAGGKVPAAQLPTVAPVAGQVLQVATLTDGGSSANSTALVNLSTAFAVIVPKSINSRFVIECSFNATHVNAAGVNILNQYRIFDVNAAAYIGAGNQLHQVPSASGGIALSALSTIRAILFNAALVQKNFSLHGSGSNAATQVSAFAMVWTITEIQN